MSLRTHNILPVIAVISNSARFATRYRLYLEFAARLKANPAVRLITVEAAFGDRIHEVTDPADPDHLCLRTNHEVWHKENMINLGVRHLARTMPDWPFFAAIDADITFVRPDWAEETMHQLQHFDVVQLWENAVDLGPSHKPSIIQAPHTSFGRVHVAEKLPQFASHVNSDRLPYEVGYAHTGYAWAYTRRWYENVGKLIDFAVVGAADHHMAHGMVGHVEQSMPAFLYKTAPAYAKRVHEWADRAALATNSNVGYVPGTILHHWHGRKSSRNYWKRWEVIERNQFDPDRHLAYDPQGLIVLSSRATAQLRDDLRAYFSSRCEDSIDTE